MLRSAGPVSDRFILSEDPVAIIEGPQGSGKTTACVKKALLETMRMRPGSDGVRRYTLGIWRQKYGSLWSATIPSWWKLLPKDFPGSTWAGSSPREADHVLSWRDNWGDCVLTARFRAFGELANPEDLRGNEFMDAWPNEFDTLPEDLITYLVGRIGRDPPFEISARQGRIFGDQNAPDVTSSSYRDLHEEPKDGYRLYRQPGGLAPDAENLEAVGPGYYEQQARLNAHRHWWVRRMVDNLPGFTRDIDLIYPKFDDVRMVYEVVEPIQALPVLVGIDGGYTPAAVYCQETTDGQLRVIAEVAMDRGGMAELAREMLALEARLMPGCDFADFCDPAMGSGEDLQDDNDRKRLSKHLGRTVKVAETNDVPTRHDAVRDKLDLNLEGGRPGLIICGPRCKGLRRGFNQTYHFRKVHGTDEIGSVKKAFDSHVHDGLQYAALQCGSTAARIRKSVADRARKKRLEEARKDRGKRYNPLSRRHG